MMQKSVFSLGLAMLASAIASPAVLADEMWTTEEYDVVYESDRNQTAIWSYGEDGTIFIDGLAGEYTDRGSYTGYWVQPTSSVICDTYREGADGEPTYYWGRFEITFLDPDFPSRWQADVSLCDLDPVFTLNGTPVTP
ncbi:MAG: hypothetical protein SAJ12_18660 [Jaaginema sp. PMC 1079.18]|nr:hypothetical protein [Jaaginema sp. PMC 1080.18]MEC4853008.1 hypothetical protein [Jaaginema sp. PMC 1079.18]MEC4868531.1 hypothetical protein [Jaaginema sp. PMC 1078.18]